MKSQTIISLVAAAVLAMTSVSAAAQGQHGERSGAQAQDRAKVERGQRDFDRDRLRDRDQVMDSAQDRDQERKQDRLHQPENGNGIYGGELMTEQERNQYREQLRLTESDPEARTQFLAQHREKMQLRATEQGRQLGSPSDDGS